MRNKKKDMEITEKEFVREMARNGGKTICSCEEYLNLALDTFFQLLKEGKVIHFHSLFKTEIITAKERETWNIGTKKMDVIPEHKCVKIRVSPVIQKEFNE